MSSLGFAASSCDSQGCWSKVVENEEEGQGLELLQMKGSKAHRKICPVPSRSSYSPIAINCPTDGDDDDEPGSSCLEGNRAFHTFHSAWEQCGSLEECGAVMESRAGKFYLRRESDPKSPWDEPGVKLFKYDCSSNVGNLKNIENNAIAKAEQLAKKGREHEGTTRWAEEGFVADSKAKASAARKISQMAAARSQAKTKAAHQVFNRQHTSGHFAKETRSSKTHSHSKYDMIDESKQHLKVSDKEVDRLTLELDRLNQEAEAKAQEAKRVEARIKHIKATAAMKPTSQQKARSWSTEHTQRRTWSVHKAPHQERPLSKDRQAALARAEHQEKLARARAAATSKSRYHHSKVKESTGAEKFHGKKSLAELAIEKAKEKAMR